jgi:hypothetical protein
LPKPLGLKPELWAFSLRLLLSSVSTKTNYRSFLFFSMNQRAWDPANLLLENLDHCTHLVPYCHIVVEHWGTQKELRTSESPEEPLLPVLLSMLETLEMSWPKKNCFHSTV